MNTELPSLVILGRDGVINQRRAGGVCSPDDWHPIPGSLEAVARLNHLGIATAIATNQPVIGEGLCSIDDVNRVHVKLQKALARLGGHCDGIFFCPHDAVAGCDCRKPAPGLLYAISRRFDRSLVGVPVIGDRVEDAEAAAVVGARPVMLRTGDGAQTYDRYPALRELPWFDDLDAATDYLTEGIAAA